VRKIISFTHATLDGYIDNPHKWSFQYSDEELQAYELKMTLAADALLLGRITYEGMAQAWPIRGGNPFADHVNSITKYVVASQPVDTTAWDPTVVIAGPDLLDEVSRLKQAEDGDLLIWGTGQLTDALAAAGLLDEYRICTCPVIKGGGEPLFRPASTGTVELFDTKIFATGAVVHAYRWLDEGKAMPESLAQAGAVKSFGALPLIVLSRGLTVDPDQDWQRMQTELLGLSSNSQQLFADKSGHSIQLDQPEAAVDAIVMMVEHIRTRASAR
jgi:dihydrofolate reductase